MALAPSGPASGPAEESDHGTSGAPAPGCPGPAGLNASASLAIASSPGMGRAPPAAPPCPAAPAPAPLGRIPPISGVSYGVSRAPASMASRRLRPLGSWPRARPGSAAISPASSPSAGVPRTKPCSSASLLGTRCSGVPVMTRRPNPVRSVSSGVATHGVTAATSGADTA